MLWKTQAYTSKKYGIQGVNTYCNEKHNQKQWQSSYHQRIVVKNTGFHKQAAWHSSGQKSFVVKKQVYTGNKYASRG